MIKFDDPTGETRREIVNRREKFASASRFIVQVAAGLSMITALWVAAWYPTYIMLGLIVIFMLIFLASSQDLMYEGTIKNLFKGDDIDPDEDFSDVDLSGVRLYKAEEDDDELGD